MGKQISDEIAFACQRLPRTPVSVSHGLAVLEDDPAVIFECGHQRRAGPDSESPSHLSRNHDPAMSAHVQLCLCHTTRLMSLHSICDTFSEDQGLRIFTAGLKAALDIRYNRSTRNSLGLAYQTGPRRPPDPRSPGPSRAAQIDAGETAVWAALSFFPAGLGERDIEALGLGPRRLRAPVSARRRWSRLLAVGRARPVEVDAGDGGRRIQAERHRFEAREGEVA
jgi:hypothetical protein